MSKITLSVGEYRNIFELASTFKGDSSVKLSALKVMEKISKEAGAGTVDGENGEKTLPESITIDLSNSELNGYWKGIVGYINNTEVTVDRVLLIKALAGKLRMTKRFEKLEETISVSEDETPLDD
jgi:hypothetical protein